MIAVKKVRYAIVVCAFSVFVGCSEYSMVAEYSDSRKVVRFEILDPTICDFAREIQVKVYAFGNVFGPYDLEMLECTKSFSQSDYKLRENERWVVLAKDFDSGESVIIAVDLGKKIVVDENTGFPDEVLEFIKSGNRQNETVND